MGAVTTHMLKGVAQGTVTARCGKVFKQNPEKEFGTIWETRVTCPNCKGEVVQDDQIEWE